MQLNLERDVYAVLRSKGLSPEPLRLLLEHPITKCLITEGGCYHYLDHDKGSKLTVLKGLTSILHAFYWPTYSHRSPARSAKLREIEKARASERKLSAAAGEQKVKQEQGTWPTAMSAAKGSVRGSIVHRQLSEWIRGQSKQEFLARNGEKHNLTEQALAALKKAHLQPVAAEYQVAWTEGRFGTAIDILCVNMRTGRVTFVEMKTSKTRAGFILHENDVPFAGKLGKINNAHGAALSSSDCGRARIQLVISVLMAIEGVGFRHDFDCCVLLLAEDQKQAELFQVSEKFLVTYGVPLYLDIKQRLPRWRLEQRAFKQQQQQQQQQQVARIFNR